MRILFMNPEAMLGGAERSLVDVLWSFRKTRPDVGLGLLLGGDGPLTDEVESLGIDVFRVRIPTEFASFGEASLRTLGTPRALRRALGGTASLAAHVAQVNRAIREFAPSILHTNGMKSHVVAALAAPPKLPLVWHVRDFIGERRVGARLLKALSWRPRLVIANSRAVAEDVRCLLPRVPTRVVFNGIDTERFRPDGELFPLEDRADIRVGLVATYARWKGHELFLQAAKHVLATNDFRDSPDVRFYVVGGPVYRTADSQLSEGELRERVHVLGIERHVSFIPFQRDPAPVFRKLDIVVHASSRPEPFGRTIVEAMACGCALVGVAEGGALEVLRQEENALAVAPRDANALANAILRLLGDPTLRHRLGEAARRDAIARFSRDRLATEILQAYRAVAT